MKDYRKLIVWQKAHRLVLAVYKETSSFPREEKYLLTDQIRRASMSVPTNIAEGCGKFTQKDFAKYLQDAFGSAQEVEYLNFLSLELGYQKSNVYQKLDKDVNEIKAMLIGLLQKIRKDI
ncbi:MAG TPA: four helix bundle protein [Ohtaekwangia sp.]|uniref:four helix bundle protein n=1 Tax=Ohtaekwangia sp. TaxID=2066019 RepID=UPI002F91FE6D